MVKADPNPPITYFAPLIGIAAGAMLGWFIMYANEYSIAASTVELSSSDPSSTYTLWAGRFMALTTACSLWSIITLPMQKKSLYGGGMIDRNDESLRRDGLVILFLLILWVGSAVAFAVQLRLPFMAMTVIHSLILISETGWRDPLWVRTIFDGNRT